MIFTVKSGQTLVPINAAKWELREGVLRFYSENGRVIAQFVEWDGFWEE